MTAGLAPAFNIPDLVTHDLHMGTPWVLLLMIPFGILIGLASCLFIKALDKTEDLFESMPGGYIGQHILGMFLLGLLIYAVQKVAGHYYVAGIGYATVTQILKGLLSNPWFLLILFVLKLIATCLTLGSGASGGVFSPSLFMGAALGAVLGHVCFALFGDLGIPLAAFAIAGMAAAISGATGAVLTAVAMTYEMTLDYNTILLVLIATTASWSTRKILIGESIYTIKLLRRGHVVPEGLQSAMDHARRATDIMCVKERDTLPYRFGTTEDGNTSLTTSDGLIVSYIVVGADALVVNVIKAMERTDATVALVSDDPGKAGPENVLGWVGPDEITAAARRTARLMP